MNTHALRFLSLLPFVVAVLGACGSTSESGRAGAMTPTGPDRELDAATPIPLADQKAVLGWLGERIEAANTGHRERVRIPVIHRPPAFGTDQPTFAIAVSPSQGPFYWIHIDDRTSAGIPPGEWIAWAEGRFTGALRNHHSNDNGGSDMSLPVFEMVVQRARNAAEPVAVRMVRE